jgi:hypothetical protein
MSVPLMVARRGPGRGPQVPLKHPAVKVTVEGLCEGDTLIVTAGDSPIVVVPQDGEWLFEKELPAGTILRAATTGPCQMLISVWVE